MEHAKAPGLKYRARKHGAPVAYWIASPAAVKAGYTPKSVQIHVADVVCACQQYQAQMLQWLSGAQDADKFDGSFRSLFRLYETDDQSKFHKLKRSSRKPYLVYLRKLYAHIGDCQIRATDGRDLRRWHALWASPAEPGKPPRIASAHLCVSIIRAAISFGVACRKPGCADFKAILDVLQFEQPKPRTQAPTAAQIVAARCAAHANGSPSRALAYAIQFETSLRQWDVVGQWEPLADPRPSDVLAYGEKWIGPTWANIDANMVLRSTPGKTEDTSAAKIAVDLRECQMVMDEIAKVPADRRTGPLIVSEATALPYRGRTFGKGWREDRDAAGIPSEIWNRDLRAGGVTEARESDAKIDDVKKMVGHTAATRTTARVYDRDALEASRRVSRARAGRRTNKTGNES